ncbi:MAG: type I methionyl aminopeptidase [Albidovulum sp.]|nr:type I methionyl aminopeptidase [Albidovulum sp.]MDE0532130.1 type I methionyl aminopeptidase [Albidovulum sp.]
MDFSRHKVTRDGIRIYPLSEFSGMRTAGRVAAQILDDLCDVVRPGIKTIEIDDVVRDKIREYGVKSSTIGYRGYNHASCISVNHVVCHGIPGSKVLQEGDILNIDVTVTVDGWYGDSSRMYAAGRLSRKASRLLDVTYQSLMLGIGAVKPGASFGDIGHAIQKFAESHRMSVVRNFCGHGIGREFHLPPNVLHFGSRGTGPKLEPGMLFTIEPMINVGKPGTKILSDNWTAVTLDRSLSAQFEHTVGVTENGYEIFTHSPGGKFHPTWSSNDA